MNDPLHALELRLSAGLTADADAAGIAEAVARLLLAAEEGRGISMREMARRLDRDPSTVTRFVDKAAASDLMERRAGATDRRQRMVVLTEQGTETRARLLEARRARQSAWLEAVQHATGLGEGQVTWFLEALIHAEP